jgi:hypothetical protein
MAGVGAQTAVAAVMFGTFVAMGGFVAATGAPVGLPLAAVGLGGFVGGMTARMNAGAADSFARDVAGVVGLGAVVALGEGVGWWCLYAIGEGRFLDGHGSATLASFLLGAALVPMSAALWDLERRRSAPPRSPGVSAIGGVLLVCAAPMGVVGVEDGAPVAFVAAMAVAALFVGTRVQGLAPAIAAVLAQAVVALLVSLAADKLGAVVLAECAWRLALVWPALAPMVAGIPTRSDERPRKRMGWAETGAMTCSALAVTAAVGGAIGGVKQDEPLLALPVVAALAFVPSVGAGLFARLATADRGRSTGAG